MKLVCVKLPTELESVNLHIFSDWHVGDTFCDMAAIHASIDAVKDDPTAYVICNGDLMNNATKQSVSDIYAEKLTPHNQLDALHELLEPIKDKIIFMSSGNHENRTYKDDGIELGGILAVRLGLEDKYCREGGALMISFGKSYKNCPQIYTLYITHGDGGGRREGGKINKLADLSAIIGADIYIHSHTHLPAAMKQTFLEIERGKHMIKTVERLFVNTSAKLKYGGYGERKGFKPNSIADPIIHLDGKKKDVSVTL